MPSLNKLHDAIILKNIRKKANCNTSTESLLTTAKTLNLPVGLYCGPKTFCNRKCVP